MCGGCNFPEGWTGGWFQSGIPGLIYINSTTMQGKGECAETDSNDKFLVYDSESGHVCVCVWRRGGGVLELQLGGALHEAPHHACAAPRAAPHVTLLCTYTYILIYTPGATAGCAPRAPRHTSRCAAPPELRAARGGAAPRRTCMPRHAPRHTSRCSVRIHTYSFIHLELQLGGAALPRAAPHVTRRTTHTHLYATGGARHHVTLLCHAAIRIHTYSFIHLELQLGGALHEAPHHACAAPRAAPHVTLLCTYTYILIYTPGATAGRRAARGAAPRMRRATRRATRHATRRATRHAHALYVYIHTHLYTWPATRWAARRCTRRRTTHAPRHAPRHTSRCSVRIHTYSFIHLELQLGGALHEAPHHACAAPRAAPHVTLLCTYTYILIYTPGATAGRRAHEALHTRRRTTHAPRHAPRHTSRCSVRIHTYSFIHLELQLGGALHEAPHHACAAPRAAPHVTLLYSSGTAVQYLSLSGVSRSCDRAVLPGLAGDKAYNLTLNGTCEQSSKYNSLAMRLCPALAVLLIPLALLAR
ncbi:hypothetical protein HF086_011130 [Spodoptera exigua]|uniref:DUF7044 domain-containing protein n=1 Tax=Spodoptera exigua TaxID=7107 RepID=A0A922MZ58_SPOEX|nr:hypothetical protein HF086_011130 [Spodoptera exigua]